jgi:hypothetical protein
VGIIQAILVERTRNRARVFRAEGRTGSGEAKVGDECRCYPIGGTPALPSS